MDVDDDDLENFGVKKSSTQKIDVEHEPEWHLREEKKQERM